MSKEDLTVKPVDQELTKDDLKKVNGAEPPTYYTELKNCKNCPSD